MESAYTLANKELEQIRAKNKEIMAERRREVISKAPRLSALETDLMKCGTRLLNCVLKKCEDLETIKKDIKALQSEKTDILLKNGFSEDYLDDIYTCSKCRDTGFSDGLRCDCLKSLVIKYIGENSNLTDYMRNQTFENFDFSLFANQGENSATTLKVMQKLCERAMNFADNFEHSGENFLVMGNAGTGKTFITSCIANRALERGKTVYYQTAFKLFEIFSIK